MSVPAKNSRLRRLGAAAITALTLGAVGVPAATALSQPAEARVVVSVGVPGVWGWYGHPAYWGYYHPYYRPYYSANWRYWHHPGWRYAPRGRWCSWHRCW